MSEMPASRPHRPSGSSSRPLQVNTQRQRKHIFRLDRVFAKLYHQRKLWPASLPPHPRSSRTSSHGGWSTAVCSLAGTPRIPPVRLVMQWRRGERLQHLIWYGSSDWCAKRIHSREEIEAGDRIQPSSKQSRAAFSPKPRQIGDGGTFVSLAF